MSSDELYDAIQEVKTALVITTLVAAYCFFEIIKFSAAQIAWKEICAAIGLIVVSAAAIILFYELLRLKTEFKNIPEDSD